MNINRNARRVSLLADARLSAKSDGGAGELEGYLATFGNIDNTAETFKPGAFKRSIDGAIKAGKVPLMARHFRDGGDALDCVGTIVEAKEDSVGLWIRAQFSSDPAAQVLRTRVKEGHIKSLSVGFLPVAYECRAPETDEEKTACMNACRDEILTWTEVRVVEGTITVRPANEEAGITSAKSTVVTDTVAAPAQHTSTAKTPAKIDTKEARKRRMRSLGVVTA